MSYKRAKNIYDDGNIPDSDLPERTGSSQGDDHTNTKLRNGYGSYAQNGFPFNSVKNTGNHSDGSPSQAPLAWTTPPALPSEADRPISDSFEML